MVTVAQAEAWARKGIDVKVRLVGEKHEAQYPKWCHTVHTDQAYITVAQISGFGYSQVRKEREAFRVDSRVLGGTKNIYPYRIGNIFECTKQQKYTDLYAVISRPSEDMGVAHFRSKELLATGFFNDAFNTAVTHPDGKELCSTSHSDATGGTQSNYGDGTNSLGMTPLNVEKMLKQIRQRKDTRRTRTPFIGKFWLVAPVDLEPDAIRICNSTQFPGSNANDTNQYITGRLEPLILDFLSSETAHFIIPKNKELIKAFMLTRIPFAVESDYEMTTGIYKFQISEEIGFFTEDWRWIQGSPGT